MKTKNVINAMLLVTSVLLSGLNSQSALAASHGHHDDYHDKMMGDSHSRGHESMEHSADMHGSTMHDSAMPGSEMPGSKMKSVMGHGVVNKVTPEAQMINITHEPMQALNWPKMRMNFKVDKDVDLSTIQPGQQVEFMLQVMEGNNYLVKEVKPK